MQSGRRSSRRRSSKSQIDEQRNAVRVYAESGSASDLAAAADRLAAQLGVPVIVDTEVSGSDASCTNRDHCTTNLPGGARIHRGTATSTWYCSTGFLVKSGTDVQMLTAGHCGWRTPQNWFHQGYSTTNSMFNEISDTSTGTLYVNNGKDIMRTGFPDSWATTGIYGESLPVDMQQDATPLQGEAIWFSGSTTNAVVSVVVTTAWTHWTSEHCNCTAYGAKADWVPQDGDSGAPVYSKYYSGSPYPRNVTTPKGIVDHQNGGFARVFDATVAWNLTMYGQ
jgi:hypothetical protein